MIQAFILLATLAIVYVALRSEGGAGLTIKFNIPSYSTSEGKRIRAKLVSLLLLIVAALVSTMVSEADSRSLEELIAFSAVSGAVLTYVYRKKK
jgi:hypothetical protein